ncbi:DUF7927 domain-containing protein (plasmid) [Coraliomargarita sp. W4R53]
MRDFEGSDEPVTRRTIKIERKRARKLTIRHRWYAGSVATVLSAALVFTGMSPALAEEATPTPTPVSEQTSAAEETLVAEDETSSTEDAPAAEDVPLEDAEAPVEDEAPADEEAPVEDEAPAPDVEKLAEARIVAPLVAEESVTVTAAVSPTSTDLEVLARTTAQPLGTSGTVGTDYSATVGATFQLYTYTSYAAGPQAAVPDAWAKCTIVSGGSCTINVPNTNSGATNYNKQYWVVQTASAAGTYFSTYLLTGSYSGPTTSWSVPGLTKAMQANTTQTMPRSAEESSATGKSFGAAANSIANPHLEPSCTAGLKVALLMDLSDSVTAAQRAQFRTSIVGNDGLFDALTGTNSSIAIFTFGENSPAGGTSNYPVPLALDANRTTLNNRIDVTTTGTQTTNWDRGLRTVAAGAAANGGYDMVLFITDGAPNYIASANGTGAQAVDGYNVTIRSLEAAIYSANAVKAGGARMVGVGVGNGIQNAGQNLRAVSGTVKDSDYFQTSNWETLTEQLANIAKAATCQVPINVTKEVYTATGNTSTPDPGWSVSATPSNVSSGTTTLAPSATSQTTNAQGKATWQLSFTQPAATATVTIAENEASKPGYGFDSGSCVVSHFGGSSSTYPLATTTIALTGILPSDRIDCTIKNRPNTATIVVKKTTNEATSTLFPFASTLPTGGSFTGTGSAAVTGGFKLAKDGTYTIKVPVGTVDYSISENDMPSGWRAAANPSCVAIGGTVAVVSGPNSVKVSAIGAGTTLTCTFSNTNLPAPATEWNAAKFANPITGTSADPASVLPGSQITYYLYADNKVGGNQTVTNLVLSDSLAGVTPYADLPTGFPTSGVTIQDRSADDPVDSSPTQPPVADQIPVADRGTVAYADGTLTWTIPSLAADKRLRLSFTVTVHDDAFAAKIVNRLTATGSKDPNSCTSAKPCETFHSTPTPAWAVHKTSNPRAINVPLGSSIDYTVTATNTGLIPISPALLTDDLTDVLVDGVTLDESSLAWSSPSGPDTVVGPAPTFSAATNLISGSVTTLAPGESVALTYTIDVGDHSYDKELVNKAWGTGIVPPTTCDVDDPCKVTHLTPGQPKLTLIKVVDSAYDNTEVKPAEWKLTAKYAADPAAPELSGQGTASGAVWSNVRYDLLESDGAPGWTVKDGGTWSCVDAAGDEGGFVLAPIADGPAEASRITLYPNADVTCTITNTEALGTLTLEKIVENDHGGDASDTDWMLSADGTVFIEGVEGDDAITAAAVPAGDYELSESGTTPGYKQTDLSCLDGDTVLDVTDASVAVTGGADVVCTFTNEDIAPTLTLVKKVENNDAGTHKATEWTLTAATGDTKVIDEMGEGSAKEAATTKTEVMANVAYTLSEDGPGGYDASTWSCEGGASPEDRIALVTDGSPVTLALDTDVVCTITNTAKDATGDHEKSVASVSQAADGTWTIVYDITVKNSSEASTLTYDLSDTLMFGSGITVMDAAWTGPDDTDPVDFDSLTSTIIATDATLAQNDAGDAAAVYTVTVHATIAEFPTDGDEWQKCTEGDGGFRNMSSLTIGEETTTSTDCREPAFPEIEKIGLPSTQDPATGSWTVEWLVTVTNTGDYPVAAVVEDVFPSAPAGWTLAGGTWSVANGADTPTVDLDRSPSASSQLIWETTDNATRMPVDATYTYTITGELKPSADATAIGACDPQTETGGLINTASVSSGEAMAEDDGCVETETVPATPSKSVLTTTQLANGSWAITYLVTVENKSADLVTVYDLNDTPLLDGTLIVPNSARWARSDSAGVPAGEWTSFDPTSGANLVTDQVLPAGEFDYYVVEVAADVTPAAWEDSTATTCAEEGSLEEGGFLNSVTLTSNGEESTADACSEPALPTVDKTGVSVVQDDENPDLWTVNYQVTVAHSGFPTFYTLNDQLGFPTGLTIIGNGRAQLAGSPDMIAVKDGEAFPEIPVELAADEDDVWTISWDVELTAPVAPEDLRCGAVPGQGFYNLVALNQGDTVIDDSEACLPVKERAYPSIEKTVTSTQQNAETGKWTITYNVVASLPAEGELNPDNQSARYNLTDELQFGGDINVESASWRLADGPEMAFASDNTATLAVFKKIEPGQSHIYTVTAVADVSAAAIEAGTATCYPDSEDPAGGFLNTVTMRVIGQTLTADDCAEPVFPEVDKSGAGSTLNADGSWSLAYDVTVSIPPTDQDPVPSPVGFTLTDEPTLPAGVELADGTSWMAEATDGGPLDNASFNGSGTWMLVDAGELVADGNTYPTYNYRITADVVVTQAPEGDLQPCRDTEDTGILVPNSATITSGEYEATDDGCNVVHFDDVGIVKSATDLAADGSVESGQQFSYVLTVTNYGTRPATDVTVVDDDLNDRLEIDGLTVEGGYTWSPAPGYVGNDVELTIDEIPVDSSVDITIVVTFTQQDTSGEIPALLEDEVAPMPEVPLEMLENEACVSMENDGVAENNCDELEIPTRDISAAVYTRCVNEASLLGWTVVKSSTLTAEPIDFLWTPLTGDATTSPANVSMNEAGGTSTWADEIQWPGTEFSPSGISIDYPGWRAIERQDLAPDGQYYFPGTDTVMTAAEQSQYVFNGLIVDPSELDFAWSEATSITFSVNPELTFTTAYPAVTPDCAVARHTEVTVEKTASVERSEPGESFDYTISAENVSTDSAAEGVVVTDSIPSDLRVTAITWPGMNDVLTFPNWQECAVDGQDAAGYGGTLECVLTGPLQPAGSNNGGASSAPTITMTVLVNPASTASVITNVAVVDYNTFGDPDDSGRGTDDAVVLLSSLPVTGGSPMTAFVLLGLLALLGGGLTVLIVRRRRNAKLLV